MQFYRVGQEVAVRVFVMLLNSAVARHGQIRRQAVDKRITRGACQVSELPYPEVIDDVQRAKVGVKPDLSLVGFPVDSQCA